MRIALSIAAALVLAQVCHACDCVPPDMLARNIRTTLQSARFAVRVRAIRSSENGASTLEVLESFKGPSAGVVLDVVSRAGQCGLANFSVGEEAVVISFGNELTACNKYEPSALLLNALRTSAGK